MSALDTYLKQWRELDGHIQKVLAPLARQQKQIEQVMQPLVEVRASCDKFFRSIDTEMEKLGSIAHSLEFPQSILLDVSQLAKPAEEFRRSLKGLICPAFEGLRRTFEELSPRTQKALILLGSHGWYLDLNMPIDVLWKLEQALEKGNVHDVEAALVEYFEERRDEIEESMVLRYPGRRKIISAAFAAHRRHEYELSIPVLLAQTDGICKEVANEYFFRRQNKKPGTAIYVEQMAADAYRAALLSPLAYNLPIGASEGERDEKFNDLNRHMVLHGESLDYGTKINSLKVSRNLLNDLLGDGKFYDPDQEEGRYSFVISSGKEEGKDAGSPEQGGDRDHRSVGRERAEPL